MPPGQGRPGYVAHVAGASLGLRFCCSAALSPSAVLFLTYYRGPELGRAQLEEVAAQAGVTKPGHVNRFVDHVLGQVVPIG